jgi:hypothetical protein
MTYRLYTERFANLGEIASRHFDGFTIVDSVGYWKGQREDSAIIEVVTDAPHKIGELAEDIRTTNHQQAVLVTAADETTWTVSRTE